MDGEWQESVVGYCREQVGPGLRSVLAYHIDGTAVEPSTLYVRDDIRAEYPGHDLEDAVQAVLDEVALESLSSEWLEHLHRFGPIMGSVRVFEQATVVHCWFDGQGLSLGWDARTAVDVEPFVRGLRETAMATDPA